MIISNKYEVLSEIGRGGMGIVYKVRHTSLDTISALKILPAHLAADPELVARFHREAKVMARLRHPNIVRVMDVDKEGDLHYFVMEYVDGKSLSALLAEGGRRAMPAVLDIAIQVTRAIAYAHEQRPAVIHRDLKPSNILVEAETGRAVVTDFGLAKLAGGAESIRTESGKFIGTLRYCAPEQLTGQQQVDGRLDVYALGMVLYEIYAGRSVYVDIERPQVIAGLLQIGVEHPFQWDPETPEAFRRLVMRATAKDRDQRYASVQAMLEALERLRPTAPPPPSTDSTLSLPSTGSDPTMAERTVRGRARARTVAVGATISVVFAVVGGIWVWRQLTQPRDSGQIADTSNEGRPTDAGAEKKQSRRSVSVMDFTAASPDPQLAWMREAIRDTLNSRLSGSPDCKVFSKEFIDFKAQQMVRDGSQRDLRAATMEVAQKLGVTKAVLGSFRADHDALHIEAHIVDMETGVQEASETVEGDQDAFVDLQARLARKIMTRLGVTPPASTGEVQSAGTASDLDNYRLLLQAEGQSAAEPTPLRSPRPTEPRSNDRRGSMDPRTGKVGGLARTMLDTFVPSAYAFHTQQQDSSADEAAIRATLETYRRACEQKDVDLLRTVYDTLTSSQIEANRKYFENARELAVAFEEIDVALGEDEAAVSYTRKDRFIDGETDRPTKVEVRLTKIMVRIDGIWKFASGRRPK